MFFGSQVGVRQASLASMSAVPCMNLKFKIKPTSTELCVSFPAGTGDTSGEIFPEHGHQEVEKKHRNTTYVA